MHLSRIRDKGNRSRTNGNRIQDMEDRTRVGKSDKFDSKAWIFVLHLATSSSITRETHTERERERERRARSMQSQRQCKSMTQQDVTRNRPSSVHYAKAVVHGIALFAAETPFAGRWAPRPLDLVPPPASPPHHPPAAARSGQRRVTGVSGVYAFHRERDASARLCAPLLP